VYNSLYKNTRKFHSGTQDRCADWSEIPSLTRTERSIVYARHLSPQLFSNNKAIWRGTIKSYPNESLILLKHDAVRQEIAHATFGRSWRQ
jgi:hypothetical protein